MPRFEHKYKVPVEKLDVLREYMQNYLTVDKFASGQMDNTYTVRSIYYDTSDMRFYHEKIEGLRVRKKLRIRGYDTQQDNSVTFLEIKRKNDSSISKNRSPLLYKNLSSLMATSDIGTYVGLSHKQNGALTDARKFFYYMHALLLKPTIKVIYDREPYFYKFNRALRLTFDKNLRSSLVCDIDSLYSENDPVYAMPNYFTLEIKGKGPYPQWLQFIIGKLGLRRQAISKYTICIDSHNKFGPPIPHICRTKSSPKIGNGFFNDAKKSQYLEISNEVEKIIKTDI
ncbi:MAG: polyphosphate polymerase domain-containing protein [Calditrichia bacterium]|nr:polyphosphate polymerase domain-containing protein [Calditrichia bacterium]